MLRDHRRVRLELAHPPAVRMLKLEQPVRRALDRGVEVDLRLGPLGCDRHAATFDDAAASTARAAARPLRTALSIVGGQGGAVQAPASATLPRTSGGTTAPGRTATVASGSRLTRDQRSSDSPSRAVTSPATVSTSSRPR